MTVIVLGAAWIAGVLLMGAAELLTRLVKRGES